MKKVGILAVILIMLLLTGREKIINTSLPFEFDEAGNYTGLMNLPKNYTVEQAENDGCYVHDRFVPAGGEDLWEDFVQSASNGKDAYIRIVHIFDDEIFFVDLFYVCGYYYAFIPGSGTKEGHKFKYMLTLEGTLPNAAKSDKHTVLTNYKKLTYHDVTWLGLSCVRGRPNKIPRFDLVMIEMDN